MVQEKCKSTGAGSLPEANLPAWVQERAFWLGRICRLIDARRLKGKTLGCSFRHFSRKWWGKAYRVNPSRKWRLGQGTLVRAYYRWKKQGDNGLLLSVCGPRKTTQQVMREILLRAADPGVLSFRDAIELVRADRDFRCRETESLPTDSTYYRRLNPEKRKVLLKLWSARKRLDKAERAAAAMVVELTKRTEPW